MADAVEILANYTALEQVGARLAGLAQSFASIGQLPQESSAALGDSGLSETYEAFRAEWAVNRQEILQELEAAVAVLRDAVVGYRAADDGIAAGA